MSDLAASTVRLCGVPVGGDCPHLNMACAVIPHAGSHAILLVGVRRAQDRCMHLVVRQVRHDLPRCGICTSATQESLSHCCQAMPFSESEQPGAFQQAVHETGKMSKQIPCKKRLAAAGTALLSTNSMPIVSTCRRQCECHKGLSRADQALTAAKRTTAFALTSGAVLTFLSSIAGISSASLPDDGCSPSSLCSAALD